MGGGQCHAMTAPAATVLPTATATMMAPATISEPTATMMVEPPAPMDAREVLYMQSCGVCHGADAKGVGGVNSGKPLGVDARHPVEDYTRWLVRNGSSPRNTDDTYVAPMPMLDENALSDSDLDQIIESLQDRNVFAQPTTGEDLYLDYCSACHAVDGTGAPTARVLAGRGENTTRHVLQGHHAGEYTNTREFMPMWDEEAISDAELQLIQDYTNSL